MVRNLLLLLLFPATVVLATVNFETCLQEVRNGDWGLEGGRDNNGGIVNVSEATAISYDLCVVACGTGPEPFVWNNFSQQFSAWLLPYLALMSQLPFGAKNRLDNLVSLLLAVGSPTLAAYSLALTVLNGHYIAHRFSHLTYPNVSNAVRILSSLQQSAIHVITEEALLASLIVLPENDEWWSELVVWLNYVHTWSISAVASILWVIIAYVFTVVDSFTSVVTYSSLNSNGQACDYERVGAAVERANKIAYVVTHDGEAILASHLSTKRAIAIRRGSGDIHSDEHHTAPIYNYARFLPWSMAVETVYVAFREASERSNSYRPVNGEMAWQKGDRMMPVRPENRQGSLEQITAYVKTYPVEIEPSKRSRWGRGMVSRFLLASFLALVLTWGTIGAAILVAFYTPTKGIACRSGSYLIYGVVSTLIWILLVISSALSHYSSLVPTYKDRYQHTPSTRVAGITAVILRRAAKTLAALNSAWVILACLFQFSSFYDRCWCNSSVFYWRENAFNVINVSPSDVAALDPPWIGGVALASGCAVIFLGFVNLLIRPTLPT
ncbi:hypothetical protein MIND_00597100 [Mycena indigotica]|uniref:Uncharacterized protein n=1 Tax=Mycena indigotica TaxID=2126181 RepID=A0A8H6W3K1_9AGAR|nr:uncharacterized protein MIND_00597100 [Mycena indigotica]KAF7303677.1 hypothetical protein MIND_00597100 [Mycena indigotica]